MLRNLLLTAVRGFRKSKFFAGLNILGLAIGMSVFLLIAQYVVFERSYENFVPDADRIYRVTLTTWLNNELIQNSAENYPGVGPAFASELPEVECYARLYNLGYKNNVIITYEDARPEPRAFKQKHFLYADSAFLPMMGYPMVKGEATTALAEPNTAVVSETYARLYFGDEDPVGKTLHLNDDDFNNELVKVTGVFKDVPSNTHLTFDVLFSYKTLLFRYNHSDRAVARYDHSWQRKDMYTFIRVRPGTNPNELAAKFPAIVDKYNPGLKERNQRDVLGLQPLRSIHLTSNLAEEYAPNGDARIVWFLGLIGLFVLVIAWINYVNLSTAKALERAKEVGVRKVMGAFKNQLVYQFLVESAIVNLVSVVLAVIFVALALPSFRTLSGLGLTPASLVQPWFVWTVTLLWMIGTMLSGFYPAIVLSSFTPVTVLKGKLKNSSRGILLRKSLVVFQFMASVALIAGTLIIYRQLNFMMKQDLGLDIDQVLVLDRPGLLASRADSIHGPAVDLFRNELMKSPGIQGVTMSITIPGKQREYKDGVKILGAPDDQLIASRINSMDYDFIDVYKMKLLAGRRFSKDFVKDPDTSAIVTESAVQLLGFKKPEDILGRTITVPAFGWNAIVVGVVNDYHQVSLKQKLDPTIFYCTAYWGEYYSIRIGTQDLHGTVDHVRQAWEKAFPGNPFEYFFLDDYFNRQYENERKFGKLFTTFAALAVFVGCLGLFGLSAYTATQRTKEIGIRKVLGSTVPGIFMLLSKEYLRLIGISIALASPLVWYVMHRWVESFPYRVPISIATFVVAGACVLIISLLTVSFQTLRAARTNPVETLRME